MGAPGPRLAPGTSEGEGLPAPPSPPRSVWPPSRRAAAGTERGPGLRLAVGIPSLGCGHPLPWLCASPPFPRALNVPPSPFPGTGIGALCCAVCAGRQCPLAELPCRGSVASLNLTPPLPAGFCLCKGAPALHRITQSRRGCGEMEPAGSERQRLAGQCPLFPRGCGQQAGSLCAPPALAMAWISTEEVVGSLHSR